MASLKYKTSVKAKGLASLKLKKISFNYDLKGFDKINMRTKIHAKGLAALKLKKALAEYAMKK